jgi:hypothetical protein
MSAPPRRGDDRADDLSFSIVSQSAFETLHTRNFASWQLAAALAFACNNPGNVITRSQCEFVDVEPFRPAIVVGGDKYNVITLFWHS